MSHAVVERDVVSRVETVRESFHRAVSTVDRLLLLLMMMMMLETMRLEARHPAQIQSVSRFRHGYAAEGRRVVILMMDRHH